jgi:pimeloyl-ACP methyl ester carboxylesterase
MVDAIGPIRRIRNLRNGDALAYLGEWDFPIMSNDGVDKFVLVGHDLTGQLGRMLAAENAEGTNLFRRSANVDGVAV